MSKLGKDIKLAASIVRDGGVIAFPTETVMGLGVVYDNYDAYQRLNKIKGRPESKPYTMMLGDINDINKYAEVSSLADKIIKKYMPGPLTLLLKAKNNVPDYVTHNTGIVGIRVPNHELLLNLLKEVQKPLLVPSANPTNEAPAVTSSKVCIYFGDLLDYIIDYNSYEGKPSTILDLSNNEIKLIREGELKHEVIVKGIKE